MVLEEQKDNLELTESSSLDKQEGNIQEINSAEAHLEGNAENVDEVNALEENAKNQDDINALDKQEYLGENEEDKLKKNADEYDNNGLGIDYYGFNVEMDIQDLDFASGTVSGTFSATLYRATAVSDPSNYMGVDGVDADLFNPATADFIDNIELVDSIRIENGVFQRITLINNTSIN